MQSMTTLKFCSSALVAVALSATMPAEAAPPTASPEMQRALAKAEQGPEQLRWYVQRTRSIYNLDFYEVMARHEAAKTAQAETPVTLANSESAKD